MYNIRVAYEILSPLQKKIKQLSKIILYTRHTRCNMQLHSNNKCNNYNYERNWSALQRNWQRELVYRNEVQLRKRG